MGAAVIPIVAAVAGATTSAVATKQMSPNRKDQAALLKETSAVQAVEPPADIAPPTITDATSVEQEARKKLQRQRGRAATILGGSGVVGDDSTQSATAKATLGA